jgi:ribosomal protein L32E
MTQILLILLFLLSSQEQYVFWRYHRINKSWERQKGTQTDKNKIIRKSYNLHMVTCNIPLMHFLGFGRVKVSRMACMLDRRSEEII